MANDTTVPTTGSNAGKSKSVCRYVTAGVRILLALLFLIFGLNGFLHFMPEPKTMPENIKTVAGALMQGGYMNVVSATEVIVGALLLLNLFVPLALALLAPIIVGILTFHIALAPESIGPGVVVTIMELYLAWAYRNAFRPMLAMRVTAA